MAALKKYEKPGRKKIVIDYEGLYEHLVEIQENKGYLALSMRELIVNLKVRFPLMKSISDSTLRERFKAKYGVMMKRVAMRAAKVSFKDLTLFRRCLAIEILKLLDSHTLVLFLDESSIQPENFQKKVISMRDKPAEASLLTAGLLINILSCVSYREVEVIQVFERRVYSIIYGTFIKRLLNSLRNNSETKNLTKVAIQDNLHIHSNSIELSIFNHYQIKLIYTSQHSPLLKMTEIIFLFIKSELRRSLKKTKS